MAFDFQKFLAIGRLTRDPEAPNSFQNGRSVIRFSIAFASESYKDKQTGEWVNKPCYLECEAWQGENGPKLVDVVDKYARKGTRVHIEGKLKLDEWEDKNTGDKRKSIKLVVLNIIILDKTEGDDGSEQRDRGRGSNGGSRGGNSGGSRGSSGGYGGASGGGYGGGDGDGTDPIPF